MPTVPYVPVPEARPQAIPTPSVRVNASPDAFGLNIGQAVEQLGGQVSHSSDELWNRAVAMQQLRNETEAREADAQYMIEAGKLHAEYGSLQGKAAVDAFPKYQTDLDSARKRIRDGLSTDQSRKLYDASALSVMSRTIFNGAGHAAVQNKNYARDASTSRVQVLQNSVYDTPNDEVGYRRTTTDISREIEHQGDLDGWSPEKIDFEKRKHTSAALALRILGMAKNEPAKANELMEKSKGQLFGPDIKKVEDGVRTAMYTTGSRFIETKVNADLYSGDTDGRPEVGLAQRWKDGDKLADQQMPNDPLFREYVRDAISRGYEKNKKAIRDTEQDNWYTVNDALIAPQGGMKPTSLDELLVDDRTRKAYNDLPPPKQRTILKALGNNAKGEFEETPERRDRYYELLGMAQSDPAKFLDQSIPSEELPNRWKDALYKAQIAVKKGAEGDPRVGRAMRTMGPILEPLGISRSKDPTRYNQFYGAMQRAVEDHIAENKKGPDDDQVRKIGARLLQEIKTPGAIFGATWPNREQLFEMQVPSDVLEAVKADLTGRNQAPPTDEMIRQEYIRRRYKELTKSAQPKESSARGPR